MVNELLLNSFCSPAQRFFYSMADSTRWDGILMGIKSKAAPVTVAPSQPARQPLSALCLCVCVFLGGFFSNVMLICDSAESWRIVSLLCPCEWWKRQVSWNFKAGLGEVCFFQIAWMTGSEKGGQPCVTGTHGLATKQVLRILKKMAAAGQRQQSDSRTGENNARRTPQNLQNKLSYFGIEHEKSVWLFYTFRTLVEGSLWFVFT